MQDAAKAPGRPTGSRLRLEPGVPRGQRFGYHPRASSREHLAKGTETEMIGGKRVCVVMPAYRAAKTLQRTYEEIDRQVVDDVILVDDASPDDTVRVARDLGLHHVVHPRNRGYGGNQKTCYAEALARGADVVVMLHPDYQYSPRLVPAMAAMVASGHFDCVLGSRILGVGLRGGMPLWKYIANRLLTFTENLLLGYKLAEYHTGYRAFSRRLLETLPLEENSDDFVFDNQFLAQALWFGFDIGEVTCPARYFAEASSINFGRSVKYGFGVLGTALEFRLARMRLVRPKRLSPEGRRLPGVATPVPSREPAA
jgi:glycosyltransferase involved in cell wall biosynthesis